MNSLYVLLKGHKHPMDLFSAQNHHQTVYGFLSVSWGFTSDVDIESEKFRSLGPLRFTIGALQRIMGLRHYHGSFHYIPAVFNPQKNGVSRSEVGVEQMGNAGAVASSVDAKNSSGAAGINTRNGNDKENIELDTQTDRPVPQQASSCANREIPMNGPKSTLPSLDAPLGEEWKQIDGEFVLITLCSLSHLGSDMHSSPGILFNDGLLDTQYVSKGTTKKTMVELMGAFETGKHIDYPDVNRLHVKAFRLVPGMERPGHVAVDGEEVEYGPVQGEIFPSLANIMLLKR